AGIDLTSAGPISLTNIRVINGGDDGIRGSTVNGFTLATSLVINNGNAANTEHGIDFTNVLGTSSISNTVFSLNEVDQVRIVNNSGTGTVTFTADTFKSNGT